MEKYESWATESTMGREVQIMTPPLGGHSHARCSPPGQGSWPRSSGAVPEETHLWEPVQDDALNKSPTILQNRKMWEWLCFSRESRAATNKDGTFFLLSECSYITTYCLGTRKLKGASILVQAWNRTMPLFTRFNGERTRSKRNMKWYWPKRWTWHLE